MNLKSLLISIFLTIRKVQIISITKIPLKKDVHLVGVKDNEHNILAACLLTEARSLKFFKYFYTHRGPVLDFNNYELVRFFYKHLTKYLKKNRGLFVLTDPYTLENIRNTQGEILESYNNRPLLKTMEDLGFCCKVNFIV